MSGAAFGQGRALAVVTLITWLFTASIGAFMLRTVITLGGLRRQRARGDSLPPAVLFAHFGLALTGLTVWAGYVATGRPALAWSAVGLLMPAIGLGISTVTLWTPFPDLHAAPAAHPLTARGAWPAGGMLASPAEDVLASRLTDEVLATAVTDEVLIKKLTEEVVASVRADPSRVRAKPKGHLAALIPVGHGMGAIITFLLAVITAAGAT